jgi:hypothetical protein
MWNNTEEGRQLLAELSKELVAEIAPEELEYVDELLLEYYEHPPKMLLNSDDPVGFGGNIMVTATPVIAMALNSVLYFLIAEVLEAAKTESAAFISQKVKAFFNPIPSNQELALSLSKEQLTTIKDIAKRELRRGGMSSKKAENAALRIMARLAIRV